jgi:hypothetical protein
MTLSAMRAGKQAAEQAKDAKIKVRVLWCSVVGWLYGEGKGRVEDCLVEIPVGLLPSCVEYEHTA